MSKKPFLFVVLSFCFSGCLFFDSSESSNNELFPNNGTTSNNGESEPCGDGTIAENEACDIGRPDIGTTCLENGFGPGTVSCNACEYDFSGCTKFKQVSVYDKNVCMLNDNGVVYCVGDAMPPTEKNLNFKEIHVGGKAACGIKKITEELRCWSLSNGDLTEENDPVQSVSVGQDVLCYISSGIITCIRSSVRSTPLGVGAFKKVSILKDGSGNESPCGLRANDNKIECLNDGLGETYTDLTTGNIVFPATSPNPVPFVCGSNSNGEIHCNVPDIQIEIPIKQMDGGLGGLCWVSKIGGNIGCIGNSDIENFPETNEFLQVSVGSKFACAVNTDGAIKCWGGNLPPI